MRLTKRQLKRIIREEYSHLKRRGLLREYKPGLASGSQRSGLDQLWSELVSDHPNADFAAIGYFDDAEEMEDAAFDAEDGALQGFREFMEYASEDHGIPYDTAWQYLVSKSKGMR